MTDRTIDARLTTDNIQSFGLPQSAAVLAYAGALPPIICSLLVLLRGDDFGAAALAFMSLYGGVLIAFFGGVRWGIAVMRPAGPSFKHLLGGVAPLLIALPIFFIDDIQIRLLIVIFALPILLIDDLRATRRGSGAPSWYLGVRTPLTVLMEAAFILAFASQTANAAL